MTQIIAESVIVGLSNSPKWVKWKGRVYKIDKVGLHHTYKKGDTLMHIFSVVSGNLFMKLAFDTKNLSWELVEISNGI